MARFICWHIQEQALGGLDPDTAKLLDVTPTATIRATETIDRSDAPFTEVASIQR
jgi:hypothetical protein